MTAVIDMNSHYEDLQQLKNNSPSIKLTLIPG